MNLNFLYILAGLFNKCLKESCFPDCWQISLMVHVFKNVGQGLKLQTTTLLAFAVSKVFENCENNRIADHLKKCDFFDKSIYLQVAFESHCFHGHD